MNRLGKTFVQPSKE